MRYRLLFPAALGLLMSGAGASAQATPRDTAAARREVEGFERELFDAVARRDRPALERMVADGFTFIHASGALDTREEYLELAAGGRLGRQRGESERANGPLRFIDDRTAIRQSRAVIFDAPLRNTVVYIKSGGRWQWALSQSTPLPVRPSVIPLDVRRQDAVVGEYEIDAARRLVVTRESTGLMGLVPLRRKFELLPQSDSVFIRFHEEGGFGDELVFLRDGQGHVTHAVLRDAAREVWRARKVK